MANRRIARQLASASLANGDDLGWFERLYAQADGDETVVPWADMKVNPNLHQWLEHEKISGEGKNALVVGCGLGDDSETLAEIGFEVVAFDISSTAINWCWQRFANSQVNYVVADLFDPPPSWTAAFDFVLEAYTLQVLPADLRKQACEQIASFVAPGGSLLVISRGRDSEADIGQMPWPLVRRDLDAFSNSSLAEIQFEDYFDEEEPPVRRFRVEYQKLN